MGLQVHAYPNRMAELIEHQSLSQGARSQTPGVGSGCHGPWIIIRHTQWRVYFEQQMAIPFAECTTCRARRLNFVLKGSLRNLQRSIRMLLLMGENYAGRCRF